MAKKKTLLEYRIERKCPVKEISQYMGINRRTLYRWEHCITQPDHWQLHKICQFYGVKISDVKIANTHPDPLAHIPDDMDYDAYRADLKRKQREWGRKTLPKYLWDKSWFNPDEE